jgi:putative transposase
MNKPPSNEFKLYPSNKQKEKLDKAFSSARWFWDTSLAETYRYYLETGRVLTAKDMLDRLPGLKREFEWLKTPSIQVLTSVAIDLSHAFNEFFDGRASLPDFKSRLEKQSIQYLKGTKVVDGSLKLPKVGIVHTEIPPKLLGNVKSATIWQYPSGEYSAEIN